MTPYIEVKFERMTADPSVEASIQRWVARLEAMSVPVRYAAVAIAPAGRRTTVSVLLDFFGGVPTTVITSHAEIYVAVADAFRAARRRYLDDQASCGRHGLPAALAA